MMNNSIKCLTYVMILLQFSCKNESNTIVEEKPIEPIDIFASNYKTKPKFFLKFWQGMSIDEKIRVTDTLINEGIIERLSGSCVYMSGKTFHDMEFIYDNNNLLKSIVLTRALEELYPIYQKKYNLQPQIWKNLAYDYYEENNPEYKPLLTYKIKGETFNLPKEFNDNIELLEISPRKLNLNDGTFSKKLLFPKDSIVIENENNVIVFKQKFTERIYPYTQYSLEYNRKAHNAEYEIEKDLGMFYFANNADTDVDKGITSEHYSRNSKRRKVKHNYELSQTISYISENDFQIQKEELLRKSVDEKIKEQNEQKAKENRKLNVLKEL